MYESLFILYSKKKEGIRSSKIHLLLKIQVEANIITHDIKEENKYKQNNNNKNNPCIYLSYNKVFGK